MPTNLIGGSVYLQVDGSGALVPDGGGGGAGTLTINSSGLGTGPTVLFFIRGDGTDTAQMALGDADIGTIESFIESGAPYYTSQTSDNGTRTFITTGSFGSAYGLRKLRILWGAEHHSFRVSYRIMVPTGFRWPTGSLGGGANTGTSHTKPIWHGNTAAADDGTGGGDSQADLVTPTLNGTGCEVNGNSVLLASGKREHMPSANLSAMVPGVETFFSYHQKPVDGDLYNTSGHTHRVSISNGFSAVVNSVACSPYGTTDVGNELYNVSRWPGWCGNDSSAEVRECYADLLITLGSTDGTNSGKAIFTHDAATLATSSEAYQVPHATWSDTQIVTIPLVAREQLGYYTVIGDDGSILANGAAVYGGA